MCRLKKQLGQLIKGIFDDILYSLTKSASRAPCLQFMDMEIQWNSDAPSSPIIPGVYRSHQNHRVSGLNSGRDFPLSTKSPGICASRRSFDLRL